MQPLICEPESSTTASRTRKKRLEMFDKAEQLYRAASNNEGLNEVIRQRGILYRGDGAYTTRRKSQFQQSS